MKLGKYRAKRHFQKTPEPRGIERKIRGNSFVIQKHRASHLHYDFRLEVDGVLKSWAIPKGPSLDPSEKRLAIQVEDHPVEYKDFEGVIPPGEYGAGVVMIWDFGVYEAGEVESLREALTKGELKFQLHGKKLQGGFVLIQTKYKDSRKNWLLIKEKDEYARKGSNITEEESTSAYSGKTLDEIERLTS
ncbi:hypothetical protein IBX65_07305 [Candidatus Aerophobetes bacterium]|nr:hypothetical protein [Candidatus Aerophobetes bacterium]